MKNLIILCTEHQNVLLNNLQYLKLCEEKKKLIIRGMQKMADDKKVDLKKIQADFEKISSQKQAKSA